MTSSSDDKNPVVSERFSFQGATHPRVTIYSRDSHSKLLDWCSGDLWAPLPLCQAKTWTVGADSALYLKSTGHILAKFNYLFSQGQRNIWPLALRESQMDVLVRHIFWRSDSGRIPKQWLHTSVNVVYRGTAAVLRVQKTNCWLLLFLFQPWRELQVAETLNSHDRIFVCYPVFSEEIFGICVFGEALAAHRWENHFVFSYLNRLICFFAFSYLCFLSVHLSPRLCRSSLLHQLRSQCSMILECAIDGEMPLGNQWFGRLYTISNSGLQLRIDFGGKPQNNITISLHSSYLRLNSKFILHEITCVL